MEMESYNVSSIKNSIPSKFILIGSIILLIYSYFKIVAFSYWKKRNVPHETPVFPFGNITRDFLMKKVNFGNFLRASYEKFKGRAVHGLYVFNTPVMMVNDLNTIKKVLIRDFSVFQDRGSYCNTEIDPMTGSLFFYGGEKWKILRTKLSPIFSSGKLKKMFTLVTKVADDMIDIFDQDLKISQVHDLKNITSRFTSDTIFSLAFGVDSKILKNPNNEFREMSELSFKVSAFRTALSFFNPTLMYKLKMTFFDEKATKFFQALFDDMIDKRRASGTKRNDFLDSLIELIDNVQIIDKKTVDAFGVKNTEKITAKIQPVVAAAQAYAFFVAGFETTSSSIAHCLYELAMNPECQEKLHEEIDKVISSPEGFTYESMRNMEYLNMVFLEAGRLHPSLPFLNRESSTNYKIPDSEIVIPKGMQVLISISGIHNNPEYYPDPEKFDPTRFNKENSAARNPVLYLFFGEGPRNCIGARLGVIIVKVALVSLLANYKFSVCDQTTIPTEYTTDAFLQAPKNGIKLKVEKRQNFKIN